MKKSIITSILILTISTLIAMEESTTQSNWEKLPEEVKLHILSYLPEVGNYKDWIRAMTVSKEFHSLLTDEQFLNDFAKRLASQNEIRALNLLAEAANHGNIALTKALIKSDSYLEEGAVDLLLNLPYKSKNGLTTHENALDTLLRAGVDINATILSMQYNGLMQALFKQDIDKAKWFLRNGINLDYKDKAGKTITNWFREYYSYNMNSKERKEWLDLIKQAEAEREKAENQK